MRVLLTFLCLGLAPAVSSALPPPASSLLLTAPSRAADAAIRDLPEPGSIALLGLGLVGVSVWRRRRL